MAAALPRPTDCRTQEELQQKLKAWRHERHGRSVGASSDGRCTPTTPWRCSSRTNSRANTPTRTPPTGQKASVKSASGGSTPTGSVKDKSKHLFQPGSRGSTTTPPCKENRKPVNRRPQQNQMPQGHSTDQKVTKAPPRRPPLAGPPRVPPLPFGSSANIGINAPNRPSPQPLSATVGCLGKCPAPNTSSGSFNQPSVERKRRYSIEDMYSFERTQVSDLVNRGRSEMVIEDMYSFERGQVDDLANKGSNEMAMENMYSFEKSKVDELISRGLAEMSEMEISEKRSQDTVSRKIDFSSSGSEDESRDGLSASSGEVFARSECEKGVQLEDMD